MGKKSKRNTTTTKKSATNHGVEITHDHPIRFTNPDGSKSMVQRDEIAFFGGRTSHLGSAGMPRNASPYSLDPSQGSGMDSPMGERQLNNIKSMAAAFHKKYGDTEVDPMTEAALDLETKVGLKYVDSTRKMKLDGKAMNESMIMSTHRWIITVLPSAAVKEVLSVAKQYREALRNYKPMLKIEFPDAERTFGSMTHVTDANRPEAFVLLNALLAEPYVINVYVYSESDDEIHCFMKEFIRSSKGMINLPMDAPATEILDYMHKQAGMMDQQACFWCEKNKLTAEKLFVCTQCMSVSYCSSECQRHDWKAFHKEECSKMSGKGEGRKESRDDLGLMNSRNASLRKQGVAKPRFPLQIADTNNKGHVWWGDVLGGYITHMNAAGTLDEKTKFFPYGLHIMPREIYSS